MIDKPTVDKILEEAINGRYFTKRDISSYKTNAIGKLYEKNVRLLEQYKVLEEKEKGRYYPNDLAYKLKNADGVENHLKKEQKKREKSERKENYDYRFSKYRYWTFWIGFILGTFGGVYGFYDAFIKPQSNEEKLNKIKQDTIENKKSINHGCENVIFCLWFSPLNSNDGGIFKLLLRQK